MGFQMSHKQIMIVAILLIILLLLSLPGCSLGDINPEPVVVTRDVKIPVGERLDPPIELKRAPVKPAELPLFLSPSDPRSSSCVAADSEHRLQSLMNGREALLDGWENWSVAK